MGAMRSTSARGNASVDSDLTSCKRAGNVPARRCRRRLHRIVARELFGKSPSASLVSVSVAMDKNYYAAAHAWLHQSVASASGGSLTVETASAAIATAA